MSKPQRASLVILRVVMGWFYFYAGIIKVMDSSWSSLSYIQKANSSMMWLYQTFMSASVLPTVNFMVKWGLTMLGVSLILGLFVRLSSYLGMLLMLLLYLPMLNFPMVGKGAFIVDQHIIYICALLLLSSCRAGHVLGVEGWLASLPFFARHPKLLAWIN